MTKQSPVKVILVGIGGYGHRYYETVKPLEASGLAELVAIIDPMAKAAPSWDEIEASGLPVFDNLEAFFNSPLEAELAGIASPISFHADQACALLEAGINVLCEKPICPTLEEAQRMQEARDRSGKFLEIGYQWSFSQGIQDMKADILAGRFGKPVCLKTRVAWPRNSNYFNRNNWAGKIHNARGQAIYDSPVSNATAHFLHNMLFVLGPATHLSAVPIRISAECYRSNPIENFDTACCRIETEQDAEILFYTTHTVEENDGPNFSYEFEDAVISYESGSHIMADFKDGHQVDYGEADMGSMHKLEICVQKCRHPDMPATCSVEASIAHTACVKALQQLETHSVEEQFKHIKQANEDATLTYVPGMAKAVRNAYDERKLFSELGLPWAKPAKTTPVDHQLQSALNARQLEDA
ncbi:Gfo/Idh/MocA family protein [Coraliomargarita parva]|uniref:Gfo/Idh/MocA family protein n=1 Tax=Coraliomargarita parva TaxID=3014050 RepID=UPI0022B57070|nr:Gfo/Idh/MocA family oxidoreductase [Coraliomargarita parva]